MPDDKQPTEPETPEPKGQIRIRSNVCTSPSAWDLVPGDRVTGAQRPLFRMTDAQREERMYYARCSLCDRTIFQIHDEGCDKEGCRSQGLPSIEEARSRKLRGGLQ